MSEADWISEALEHNEEGLVRYVSRLMRDEDIAREVVQEAFMKLCRADPATVGDHVREWLYTVCRNAARDRQRQHRDRPQETLGEGVRRPQGTSAGGESPSRVVERRLQVGRLLSLLEELNEDQQEVVRLKFQDELSYQEIARITGHSVSNVGYLIHVAVKKIRTRLAEVREGSYGA